MSIPIELVVSTLIVVACLLVELWAKSYRARYLETQLEFAKTEHEALYQLYNDEQRRWHRHGLGALYAINAYSGDNIVELERIASDALHELHELGLA